jgi:hypothetical protein
MEPFTGAVDTKAPFPSEFGSITVLVLLVASLATLPLKHLFHLLQSSRARCSPVFVPDVEEKAQSILKEEFNPS